MKTFYYFIKWCFRNYKVDPLDFVFLSIIFTSSGMLINLYAVANPVKDEKGLVLQFADPYWSQISSYFIWIGISIFLCSLFYVGVIAPIKRAFRRFKQEQRDLLYKVDNSDGDR